MVASKMRIATLVQRDGDKTALRRNPFAVSLQFGSSWRFHVIGDKMVIEIIKNVKSESHSLYSGSPDLPYIQSPAGTSKI